MSLITLFKHAGATGHVFFFKNGNVFDKGLAYSGLIGPKTTIAVVPTMPQILDFAINGQTKDRQGVVVQGTIMATLIPVKAVKKFDFTVEAKNGAYRNEWTKVLTAKVIERVLGVTLDAVKKLSVEEAIRSQKDVENAVINALKENISLSDDGIVINSCSIPEIEPADDEINEAIGAQERQAMLTEADRALHERRMKASKNERRIKQYEADTALELEKKKGELLEEQARNEKKRAEADAEATGIRLAPLEKVESGKLLGAALMEGLKNGRVGQIVIAPELLGALQQK